MEQEAADIPVTEVPEAWQRRQYAFLDERPDWRAAHEQISELRCRFCREGPRSSAGAPRDDKRPAQTYASKPPP